MYGLWKSYVGECGQYQSSSFALAFRGLVVVGLPLVSAFFVGAVLTAKLLPKPYPFAVKTAPTGAEGLWLG